MEATVNNLLKSQTGRKMISNIDWGLTREHRSGQNLTEFNFIRQLPAKQLELFILIFEACTEDSRASLCVKLIKNQKIKFN